jgi:hypothetical protein
VSKTPPSVKSGSKACGWGRLPITIELCDLVPVVHRRAEERYEGTSAKLAVAARMGTKDMACSVEGVYLWGRRLREATFRMTGPGLLVLVLLTCERGL